MCGIFFRSNASEFLSEKRVHKIKKLLEVRGRDEIRSLSRHSAIMIHSRLHLSGSLGMGCQPALLCDGRILAFNGEIYNYQKLSDKYKLKLQPGYSDTDVLVKLFEISNIEYFINDLDGMFSIVLYDPRTFTTTLARDRFGQKPLYYKLFNGSSPFIEVASLINCFDQNHVNISSLTEYLTIGYVASHHSLFEDVYSVLPGQVLIFNGNLNVNQILINKHGCSTIHKNIGDAIENSVLSQINTEFPVCAALSGGVDSSIVSYYYNKHYSKGDKVAVTVSIDDDRYNEEHAALALAREINLPLHVVRIKKDEIFLSLAESMKSLSSPISDTANVTANALYSWCGNTGYKSILSGSGGDELFSGYNRHRAYAYFSLIEKLGLREIIHKVLCNYLPVFGKFYKLTGDADRKIAQIINVFSSNKSLSEFYYEAIKIDAKLTNPNLNLISLFDSCSSIIEIDMRYYLPYNNCFRDDQIGLYHSVEVRNPLLMTGVSCFAPSASGISSAGRKKILTRLRRKLYKTPISSKKGFGFPISYVLNDPDAERMVLETLNYLEDIGCRIDGSFESHSELRRYNLLCLGLWLKYASI